MIFLTLGTQLPFDRLVQALDEAAAGLDEEIIAQTGSGTYQPAHFQTVANLNPADFEQVLVRARIVVSHAGIGTILTGLKHQKPLVLMARRAAFGEHRNNHQLATLAEFRDVAGIHIAEDSADLARLLRDSSLACLRQESSQSREQLISFLRSELTAP